MGWKDDEIDDFFREAAGNRKATYDEAYWKEMEALLNAEKTSGKGIFWWVFGGLSAFLILGTGYYFFVSQNNLESKLPMSQNADPNGNFEIETKTVETNNIDVNTETLVKSTGLTAFDNTIADNDAASDNQKFNKKSIKVIEQNRDHQDLVSRKELHLGKPDNDLPVFAKKNNGLEGNPEFQPAVDYAGENSILDVNALPMKRDFDEIEFNSVQSVPAVTGDRIAQRKFGFYAAATAGAGTSYVKSSSDLLVQWRVKTGFDYTMSDRFRLGAGIGFRQQMVSNLEIRRSREYYSLGLISINQHIRYDRLQFVDLNIHAHYTFKKMAVGIEITPSYLIGSRVKMDQTQEENGKIVNEGLTYSIDNQFVDSDNFNSFGIDAGLSVQYEFKRKVCLELGVNTRLNKFLANNDFNGVYNRLPVRLELGLIKRF